jgi:hypothetical protein
VGLGGDRPIEFKFVKLPEVPKNIHTQADAVKSAEDDRQANPHSRECSEPEPARLITDKVGYDWREEPEDDHEAADNEATEDRTVADIVYLPLYEPSEALFQHSSGLLFDVVENGRVWMYVLTRLLKRSKEGRREVEFVVGIREKESLFCTRIKCGEAGCSGGGESGVMWRIELLLPICVTSLILSKPENKVAKLGVI